MPEQAAEKFDVLADAEIGIEVLAQPLRHEGDARTDRGAVRGIRHVAAEHEDAARLHLPRAGDHAEQRRLADAVGPDQPDHAAGRERKRDVIERDGALVALRDVFQARDGHGRPAHYGRRRPCSAGGHFAAGSVST